MMIMINIISSIISIIISIIITHAVGIRMSGSSTMRMSRGRGGGGRSSIVIFVCVYCHIIATR